MLEIDDTGQSDDQGQSGGYPRMDVQQVQMSAHRMVDVRRDATLIYVERM